MNILTRVIIQLVISIYYEFNSWIEWFKSNIYNIIKHTIKYTSKQHNILVMIR